MDPNITVRVFEKSVIIIYDGQAGTQTLELPLKSGKNLAKQSISLIAKQSSGNIRFIYDLILKWQHWRKMTELTHLLPADRALLLSVMIEWLEENPSSAQSTASQNNQTLGFVLFYARYWRALEHTDIEHLWEFVQPIVMAQAVPQAIVDPEPFVLGVLREPDGVYWSPVFFDDFEMQLSQVIAWFRQRLNLSAIVEITRAQRQYYNRQNKQVATLKRQQKHANRRGNYILSTRVRSQLRLLQPQLGDTSIGCSRQWQVLVLPALVFALYLVWIVTKAVQLFLVPLPTPSTADVILTTYLVPFIYSLVYGLIILFVIFRLLNTIILPEPMRTIMLFALLNCIFPTVSNEMWQSLVAMSSSQSLILILIGIAVIAVLSYRDLYQRAVKLINSRQQAFVRSVVVLLNTFTIVSISSTLVTDLALRQILYWDTSNQHVAELINTSLLTSTVIIFPSLGEYAFHFAPMLVVFMTIVTLAVATVEGGIVSVFSAARQTNF